MGAGAWTFTNETRTSLLDGTFDLDTDTFRIALFTSSSNIGEDSTTYALLNHEVETGNGYTQDSKAVTLSLSGTTTVTVDSSDPVWTAATGSIVAHYAVIYEVGGHVLCYCLLESTGPADVTVTAGNTLTITMSSSGVFSIA